MTPEQLGDLISPITNHLQGRLPDKDLEAELNDTFPAGGEIFERIFTACRDAIEAGWMCSREANGIKFGRVIKPDARLHGFSVDVVDMNDVRGPHHRHPNGEIDMVMPLTPDARFDGHGAGWVVYEPNSAHYPTVRDGRALVLYLLPQGAIEFTKTQ
ncbi:MAG TPA: DUF4863 family protein [Burkholderiales bacterium]|jgi:hypothetical protein